MILRQSIRIGACTVAVLATGCTEPADHTEHAALMRDSMGVRIVESWDGVWQPGQGFRLNPEPTLSIGAGSEDIRYLFESVVGAILLPGGRIAVADRGAHEVRLYDSSGTFLRALGRNGEGPGEFRDVDLLARYRGDSLLAHDSRLRRISIISGELIFGRSFRLPLAEEQIAWPVCALGDGSILLWTFAPGAYRFDAPTGQYRVEELLFHYDEEEGDPLKVATLPGTEIFGYRQLDRQISNTMGLPYGRTSTAGRSGDGYYTATGDGYEVRLFDRGHALIRVIRRHGAQREVTADQKAAVIERLERRSDDFEISSHKAALRRALPELSVPDTVPPFGRPNNVWHWPLIMFDDAGRMWVPRYRWTAEEEQVWDVFDSTGVFLGPVDFPKRFAPHDIWSDRVIGVWRDSDDVQHVQVYALIER